MKKQLLFFLFGLFTIPFVYLSFFGFSDKSSSSKINVVDEPLISRDVMAFAIDIVKEKKPTPPHAARFYAYTASVYADVLKESNDSDKAVIASMEIISMLYPDKQASTSEFMEARQIKISVELPTETKEIINQYRTRAFSDTVAKEPERPQGDEYWTGENPLIPSAGNWKRWNVADAEFIVPVPPAYMSEEYKTALSEVRAAADARTSKQGAAVNFWGGVPGTESPAGIWQNRLFTIVGEKGYSDLEYAYAQKVLAQTLADAFMECWKVKYTYWTKRPSMDDPDIQLAMNNPPFPSYVSGHSTISRSAAEVLAILFPIHRDQWLNDAEEAKNSRLWAGIHFPYDNDRGADLGRQIGEYVAKEMKLHAL